MSDVLWRIRRTIRLNDAVPVGIKEQVPGLLEFQPLSAGRWVVVYDVRVVQFATIAAALETVLPTGRIWRWRVAWRQFQDVNNRDSLLAKDGACCNRPPRRH